MLGAIIGDIAGSRFEWDRIKTKEFDFLTQIGGCEFTDDSVMTAAIAKAILDCNSLKDYSSLLVRQLKRKRKLFPQKRLTKEKPL